MSQTPREVAPRNYQAIFDSALEAYKKKTGKDLTSNPLLRSFENCHSPDAILATLKVQIIEPGQSQSSGDKLLTWLNPTINVLIAFSGAISATVGQAYPPVGVIFTGIGILLSAANATNISRDLLLDIFERIESIFIRLEIYIEVPRTSGMTNVIVKVMVEVLCILSIATKEINQHRTKTFLKKLVGRTDIEDALQRLEVVTREEARTAAAESLKAIHGVGTDLQKFLKAMDDRMRSIEVILQGIGRSQGVDDSVKDTGDKAKNSTENTVLQMPIDLNAVAAEGLKTAHGIDDKSQHVLDTQEGVINVDVRNSDGQTPLHVAARHGHFEAARMAIGQGANTNTRDNNDWTPLHEASRYGYLDILRLLLEHGADLNASNNNKYTPLHLAAMHGQLAAARFLVERGADTLVPNKDGWTPLHEASCYGYLDIIRLLLKHGADRNATNHNYCPPLNIAAARGQLATTRLLVEQDAVIDVPNKDGWTALHEAAFHGFPDVIRLLLEHGADRNAMNYNYCPPLNLAAARGHLAATRLLVEQGVVIDVPNKDGWTALYEAVFHKQIDIVRFLLEHSANVQAQNKDGWTPLHDASCYGYTDIIRLLLEHSANLEATNSDGNTPLHLAANKGQLAAARLLVERGAVVGAQNKEGWTPLHEASVRGHSDVIMFLEYQATNGRAGQQTHNSAA